VSELVIIQGDLIKVAFLAAVFACGWLAQKGATPPARKPKSAATNKGQGV
jgi:hypothetical protein